MNKIQKILLAVLALVVVLFVTRGGAGNANVFIAQSSTVSNFTTSSAWPTNYCTTNAAGVANIYACFPTNITTNCTQLLPSNDKYGLIFVKNNGAGAIVVTPQTVAVLSNGFVIAAGGSLTFPTVAGGAIPSVLYAGPTNSAAVGASTVPVYTEGWELKLGQ